MEQLTISWQPERRLYTVSELTARLRAVFERDFSDIWVGGELSGVRLAASGHAYFTLKDRDAQLRCVCFRNTLRLLKFKPQDGVQVLARGRIDVYEARGEYQLLVEALEPQGHGVLQLAFEQLKKKLAAEGLFEAARKRPLPKFPRRIGIVTSPSGAVIRDMINILSRRFPGLHVRLFPALVQGEGSAEAVVRGLDYFGRSGWAEVVVVARGGGSLEDLWTFNEEAVARAIAGCPVPVISAVGHETDFTIADFVADLRAPTPSAAAELLICTRQELLERIDGCLKKLRQAVRFRLAEAARRLHEQGIDRATILLHRALSRRGQRVDDLEARLRLLDPRARLNAVRRRLDAAELALNHLTRLRLAKARARLAPVAAELEQLSPLRVLERGYSIVENEEGEIVKEPAQAPEGSALDIRLARGRIAATARGAQPK